MDRPETDDSVVAVACPPDDSLVEILSRLRAKTLFRFKCVSKAWCGLIADRLRCRKFPQTLEGFFTVVDQRNNYHGGFIGLTGRPVPVADPSFSFLIKAPEIERIGLLDSCNGLVLFEHWPSLSRRRCRGRPFGYIVCNPATEQWVDVPLEERENEFDLPEKIDVTHLIFDPAVSPHFQLVQLWYERDTAQLEEVHTFSSVTGSWGRHDRQAWIRCGDVRINRNVKCPFFSGMLHIIVNCPSNDKKMIFAVDGEGNSFRTLQLPDTCGLVVFLGPSQGRLHCISESLGHLGRYELSIWVLEDYDAEKWILRHNVSYSELFGTMSCRCKINWDVVSIHPDHGLIFFVQYWNRKLISYDMDKKQARALCTLEHPHQKVIPYVSYFGESALLTNGVFGYSLNRGDWEGLEEIGEDFDLWFKSPSIPHKPLSLVETEQVLKSTENFSCRYYIGCSTKI